MKSIALVLGLFALALMTTGCMSSTTNDEDEKVDEEADLGEARDNLEVEVIYCDDDPQGCQAVLDELTYAETQGGGAGMGGIAICTAANCQIEQYQCFASPAYCEFWAAYCEAKRLQTCN